MAYTTDTQNEIQIFLSRAQSYLGEKSSDIAHKVANQKPIASYIDDLKQAYMLDSFIKALDNDLNDWTEKEIVQYIDFWDSKLRLTKYPYVQRSAYNLNVTLYPGLGSAATQVEVNNGTNTEKFVTPATLAAKALKIGTYSTELTFDTDKEIYQDVSTPTFTLASSGNINGMGIILRLNTPTSVTFPANFEADPNSAILDATKLNYYVLVYHSDWDGAGTERVIYTNTLFTAV